MILSNLKLDSFNANRNAILIEADGQKRKVFADSSVLQKAFITRAWLDRTLAACAVGKSYISAEVKENGHRLEAIKVWLSLEKNYPNESKGQFKNFGLELNKPMAETEASLDLMKTEKVAGKLARRFYPVENTDKSKSSPDLCNFRFDNDFIAKLAERQLRIAEILMPKRLLIKEFTP
ncbi:MAG: hypothetical protein R2791_00910 [Saprospiraceae bacterium]